MSESCSRLPGFICLGGIGPHGHLHLDSRDIAGIAADGRQTVLVLRTSGTLVYVTDSQEAVEQKILGTATLTVVPAGKAPIYQEDFEPGGWLERRLRAYGFVPADSRCEE